MTKAGQENLPTPSSDFKTISGMFVNAWCKEQRQTFHLKAALWLEMSLYVVTQIPLDWQLMTTVERQPALGQGDVGGASTVVANQRAQRHKPTSRDPSSHPSIYLFVYSSIHIFIYPSFHPSIHPSTHLFILPSTHLSIYPTIHPSIHLSVNTIVIGRNYNSK